MSCIRHKNIISILSNEFKMAMGKVYSPGLTFLLVRIFYFIVYSNFLGLIPYIFTPTRHLAVTVSLTLPLWFGYITFIILKNFNSFLRHLVPRGTPYILMPFMVIIEMIRISIRPLTLSVRLAANIIAGRTERVSGRIEILIISIITIKGIKMKGVPLGTKCLRNELKFFRIIKVM